ncbi:kinesin domain-containing protein, partial [Moniliophthora roreri]
SSSTFTTFSLFRFRKHKVKLVPPLLCDLSLHPSSPFAESWFRTPKRSLRIPESRIGQPCRETPKELPPQCPPIKPLRAPDPPGVSDQRLQYSRDCVLKPEERGHGAKFESRGPGGTLNWLPNRARFGRIRSFYFI